MSKGRSGGLIDAAADWFKNREIPIRSWCSDKNGRYAFAVEVGGQRFYVAAKRYLYGGQASFMTKLVRRAVDHDALLLLFVFQRGDRLVFDPAMVQSAGSPSSRQTSQRTRDGENWLDCPVDWAVAFERWVDGDAQPKGPNQQGQGTDGTERPARSWDITEW